MTGTARRGRRNTWPWLLAVLLLTGSAAVGDYYLHHRSANQLANPATVALPPQSQTKSKVRTYFTHSGKGLLVLLDHTSRLPASATRASCVTIARQLGPAGTPSALADAALSVPDPNLSAAAADHVQSVANYLGRCGITANLKSEATHAAFTATVLSRMLARDGIP